MNDIKADLFDPNTVYVALDNHKFGDLKPYLMKSSDRGKSWSSLRGNLPDTLLLWRIVQDHVNPNLFFLASEFGIYFSNNGGQKWVKLTGGVPVIPFRDLTIQRRENDLVGASFGRSFYVLDDYSPLRTVSENQLREEAILFPVRNAWWYVPRISSGSVGISYYVAPNPPYGAVFTYYLAEGYESRKEARQKKEKEQVKKKEPVTFPSWDRVEEERKEEKPKILLTVRDDQGEVVRRIEGPVTKGFHRATWDLRYPSAYAIDTDAGEDDDRSLGLMAIPGSYTVTLSKQVDGTVTDLSDPVPFRINLLKKGALPGSTPEGILAFTAEVRELQRTVSAASLSLDNAMKKVKALQTALYRSSAPPGKLEKELFQLRESLLGLEDQLYGNRSLREAGERPPPTVLDRLGVAAGGTRTSYGPTNTQRRSLEILREELPPFREELNIITGQRIPALEKKLREAGAPVVEEE